MYLQNSRATAPPERLSTSRRQKLHKLVAFRHTFLGNLARIALTLAPSHLIIGWHAALKDPSRLDGRPCVNTGRSTLSTEREWAILCFWLLHSVRVCDVRRSCL